MWVTAIPGWPLRQPCVEGPGRPHHYPGRSLRPQAGQGHCLANQDGVQEPPGGHPGVQGVFCGLQLVPQSSPNRPCHRDAGHTAVPCLLGWRLPTWPWPCPHHLWAPTKCSNGHPDPGVCEAEGPTLWLVDQRGECSGLPGGGDTCSWGCPGPSPAPIQGDVCRGPRGGVGDCGGLRPLSVLPSGRAPWPVLPHSQIRKQSGRGRLPGYTVGMADGSDGVSPPPNRPRAAGLCGCLRQALSQVLSVSLQGRLRSQVSLCPISLGAQCRSAPAAPQGTGRQRLRGHRAQNSPPWPRWSRQFPGSAGWGQTQAAPLGSAHGEVPSESRFKTKYGAGRPPPMWLEPAAIWGN